MTLPLKKFYTSREVAAMTGLSARQLQWWDSRRLFTAARATQRTEAGGFTERRYTPLDVLELQTKIQSQVKENIDKSQRRYYLQEQLKAIKKELGDFEGSSSELEQLKERLEAAKLPELVMKEAMRELSRLESIPSASPRPMK